MGGGFYNVGSRVARAASYENRSRNEIFSSSMKEEMNPFDVSLRESRDSEDHPESLAIIIAFDVTGSMGEIPEYLVRHGFVKIMSQILEAGVKDPQIMFMGVGDDRCDNAPLQVGQFESSDELLDKWLEAIFLEGHGGGNGGESYMLPWYFASKKISMDCLEKRGIKGLLFTIGDEPIHENIQVKNLELIIGKTNEEVESLTSKEIFKNVNEKFETFHIHFEDRHYLSNDGIESFSKIIGENLINVENKEDVVSAITSKTLEYFKAVNKKTFNVPTETENVPTDVENLLEKYNK